MHRLAPALVTALTVLAIQTAACVGSQPAAPQQQVLLPASSDRVLVVSPLPAETIVETDRDHDGVLGDTDQCPDEPEDRDTFQDDDGCSDPDNDLDGIIDNCDRCPHEPEKYNGKDDDDGCPDGLPIVVMDHSPRVARYVLFSPGGANLVPQSKYMLDAVAELMKSHPEIELVGLVGHAAAGEPDPTRLGERRARSVLRALQSRGIELARFEVRSMGNKQPVAEPASAQLQQNGRVEFVVVRSEGLDVRSWGPDGYHPVASTSQPVPTKTGDPHCPLGPNPETANGRPR